ncbi:hypothetical protein CC86DRAFT_39279 [Ophiobolus disseminans]|uniref:Uncharacterized protein n=1 Tax=Ophiobolus disseminans TaxID=1469910 RepID=A0A6A6ZX98_9PLEO|nr:hypothetical protein CC86DRAFT_39279 [Ophiobolus disseminans]
MYKTFYLERSTPPARDAHSSYHVHDKNVALEKLRQNIDRSQRSLSEDLNNRITAFAAPECLAICDRIQQNLPRELRDMVYQYLLSQSDVFIEQTDFLPLHSPRSSRPQLVDSLHVLQPEFCDASTRRELFEAWYKFTTFQFATNTVVLEFLSKDLWDLDLPVRQLVRNVEIDIWPGGCMFDTDLEWCKSMSKYLTCLTDVKKGARIMLPVATLARKAIWHGHEHDICKFLDILSGVFPLVKELLDVGHNVTIEVDSSLVTRVKSDDLSKEVWYQKILDKKVVSRTEHMPQLACANES